MPPPSLPSATVITPSMTAQNVSGLLESIARQTVAVEMLVVDNASPGREVTKACSDFDFARALTLTENAGFSRAVNLAAAQAEGEVMVLLNDDSICEPGFVAKIASAVDVPSGTVMAAGVMRDPRAPELIETAGIEIDHALLAFDYLNGEELSLLDGEVEPPLGPSGAAGAYRTDVFLETGGFDERIFAYWEDVDLALRLRAMGYDCALAKDAIGTHAHSSTLGSGSARKNYLMGFGRGYVLRKWGALRPGLLPAILAREIPICAGQVAIDRNAHGIRGRMAGIRSVAATEAYPSGAIASSPGRGLGGALRQRVRRRRRLRR